MRWESPSEWQSHPHGELAAPARRPGASLLDDACWRSAGAFAVWLLLFAPTLQHNTQVSPVGTRRTVSLDLVGPVAALSRGLPLSHIVSITGRTNGLPGGTVGLTTSGPRPTPPVGGTHPGQTPGPVHGGSDPATPTTVPPNPKLPTAANPFAS